MTEYDRPEELTSEQKERVRKLVTELRSGNQVQTTGALERLNESIDVSVSRCCLGVACAVAMDNGASLQRHVTHRPDGSLVQYDDSDGFLPYAAADWYGFTDPNPLLEMEDGKRAKATYLNDGLMYDFGKIADAFERTYVPEDIDARKADQS